MGLYLRGKKKIWWIRLEFRGKVLRRTARTSNRNVAAQIAAAWRTQLAKGEVGLMDHTATPTVKELTDRFLAYLPAHVLPRTVSFYTDAWAPIAAFKPLAQARLHSIDADLIERFVQNRLKAGRMPATINNSLRTLRRALHLAVEWKLLMHAPKIKLLPGEREREFVLDEDTLQKILNEARPGSAVFEMLLLFLTQTGLRLSEALDLTWSNVSFEPKDGAARGWVYVAKGKSKNAKRYVPLTGTARVALIECRKISKGQFVFTAGGGLRKLSRHWASEQFREIRDKLGLPWDCVVHSCRHTFCTNLGERGCDAYTIMKLAGHASLAISQRYVHPTPARLEQAIGMLEARPEE